MIQIPNFPLNKKQKNVEYIVLDTLHPTFLSTVPPPWYCRLWSCIFIYMYRISLSKFNHRNILFINKLPNISRLLFLVFSVSVPPMYCITISPSPVRPYPVNLWRHTWLDIVLSWLCALAQARSLARPVLPNFELPGELQLLFLFRLNSW
jgi:hypothetical protein